MNTSATYSLRPIGWVRSSLKRCAEAPKPGFEGAPNARLQIEPAFVRGLDGIRPGQDIVILTWLHEAQREVLAVHPRDDATRPLTGVFATRSADRPNPIGLHRVKVLKIEKGGALEVRHRPQACARTVERSVRLRRAVPFRPCRPTRACRRQAEAQIR
jgi:tRNA-Thr(GGU) m(6)t(6)A37 methyltransferase TsaA